MWSIPILWPIDLLSLPGRGPRPMLKTETRLTLKVMDDTEVPIVDDPDRDPSGLYRREPSAYDDAPQDEPQQRIVGEQCRLRLRSISHSSSISSRSISSRNISNRSISRRSSTSSRYAPAQQQAYAPAPTVCAAGVCAGDAGVCGTTADGVRVFRATSAAGAGLHVYAAVGGDVFAATGDVLSEHDCEYRVSDRMAVWIWLLTSAEFGQVQGRRSQKSREGALLISAPLLFSRAPRSRRKCSRSCSTARS